MFLTRKSKIYEAFFRGRFIILLNSLINLSYINLATIIAPIAVKMPNILNFMSSMISSAIGD